MDAWGHWISALLFHDRTPLAWIVVAAYFIGAAAAFWASSSVRRQDRRFWIATALTLIFLGLNKELDLQTFLTTEGRSLAQQGGWYEQRRLIQGLFLLGLAVIGFLVRAALVTWLRKSPRSVKTAAVGLVILFVFILMRAGSFHHIDNWVTINVAGLRSGWWLELTGIVTIALSALAYRRRPKRHSR